MTWQVRRNDGRIELTGELRLADGAAIWKRLRACTAASGRRLDLDIKAATTVDGAVMALLVEIRAGLLGQGVQSEIVGCRQGLAARGAAAGVGRSTTTTVVHCLFVIVLLDTLFTVAFRELGA